MTGALIIALALALSPADVRAEAARRELADVAARIEAMKAAGVRGGPEIEKLLARSQALAAELDRAAPRSAPAVPPSVADDPQELRERADALRDEVDRLGTTLSSVDARLREQGRRRRAGRLAALEEQGALFAEANPGRVGRSAAPGGGTTSGASGPSGASGGAPPPPGTMTPGTPPPAPSLPSGPLDARPSGEVPVPGSLWSARSDPRSWGDRLEPGAGDDELELRSKRDAIVAAMSEAKRRIERLEAEARELDRRR